MHFIHKGAVVLATVGLLTAGLVGSASATSPGLSAGLVLHAVNGVPDPTATLTPAPTPAVDPTPTSTPTEDSAVWADVPGDPDAGTSDPADAADPPPVREDDGFSPPPEDPTCNARSCLMTLAKYEIGNANHNREKGADNCNFYSGWWGNSGSLSSCGTYQGTRWRSNNWCADFSRWIWFNSGAVTTGIDPWAGSFYRANKSNGHYHSKGSGYSPVQGDAVLYDWDGTTASLGDDGWDIDHVGIFEKKSGSNIVVIEGNTDGGASRDGVFRRTRSTSRVVGYVTPRF